MTAIEYLLNRDFTCLCSPGQMRARGKGIGREALLIHESFIVTHSGKTDDGFSVWVQLSKEGHEILVASIYSTHIPGERADLRNRLQNLFRHINIFLCGDWNMMDPPEDFSGDWQVLTRAEGTTFSQFHVIHNRMDLRLMTAEARGYTHTRWSSYGGASRWSRIDQFYVSHCSTTWYQYSFGNHLVYTKHFPK